MNILKKEGATINGKVGSNFFLLRTLLKDQILLSSFVCDQHREEYKQLYYVLERTVRFSESDSVLLVGFKGSGKTTMLECILNSLKDTGYDDFITVNLNGLIHTDDGLALKEIICQLHLTELDGDKVGGSFSDNLMFLLQSLWTGDSKLSKPVVFILDDFHLFCSHRNQTLLYNLFEAAQANKAPICVVGVTTRVDAVELLEKRVKSRFSHRTIYLLSRPSGADRIVQFHSSLIVNTAGALKESSYTQKWNDNIKKLVTDQSVKEVLEKQLFYVADEKLFRSFLLTLICRMPLNCVPSEAVLTADDVLNCYKSWSADAKVALLLGLSTLELCLVITMSHQMELYDEEPFNFEMILNRYLKFAKNSMSVKLIERPVILKAFERIQALELIAPLANAAGRSGLKGFQMYYLLLTKDQVISAVQTYAGLHTDIIQWASSSLD